MDYSVYLPASLEIRQGRLGGPSIAGSFAYNRLAVVADRGRVRKESFGSRAFKFSIDEDTTREINVLVGHDFDKNLASRLGGSLDIEDTPAGVNFTAHLPQLEDQPTYMVDAVKSDPRRPGRWSKSGVQSSTYFGSSWRGVADTRTWQPFSSNPPHS